MSILLYILTLLITCALASNIRILKSNLTLDDGKEAFSGAKLLDDRSVMFRDFSLCIRFKVPILHYHEGVTNERGNTAPIIHIAPNQSQESPITSWFQFNAEYPISYVAFGHPIEYGSYHTWLLREENTDNTEIWLTHSWNHLCFSYKKSKSFVKIVANGKFASVNFVDDRVRNALLPREILQNVQIGMCPNQKERPCTALDGMFSDLNIWDRPLTDSQMESFTACKDKSLKGNVVNWDMATFALYNMIELLDPIESLCEPERPGNILILNRNDFYAHRATCKKLRAKVGVMDSEEQRQNFLAKRQAQYDRTGGTCWGHIWTGFWVILQEGVYTVVNDDSRGLSPTFDSWYRGEPNAVRGEKNCAAELSGMGWMDMKCTNGACGFCYLEDKPILKMRGLCPESPFDVKYRWTGEAIDNNYAFFGVHSTKLFYVADQGEWHLRMYREELESPHATLRATKMPFGTHIWKITGDPCFKDANGSMIEVEAPLSFSSCNEDEFNCMDGSCIPIDERCDGRISCPDRSDEVDCRTYTIDSTYLNFMPPSAEREDTKLPVNVSVEVLSVLGISEVDNYINLQLRIHMLWKDDRLRLFNLKMDRDLNTLTLEMRNQIWLPEIIFYNTDEKYESLNDVKASAVVQRNGTFEVAPVTSLLNGFYFKGRENPLILSRVYDYKYLCDFDMQNYPFDQQRCSAIFVMKDNVGKFVELIPDQLNYVGPMELAQYFVKASKIYGAEIVTGVDGVKVELIFARRLLSIFLTTYLPTILICIVSFATNFFKSFFFEAIVTVNLTSMLLLVTLFISVAESLPKSAYIKNIDVWLIFVLFVPFCEVVIHTLIDNLRSNKEQNPHGSSTQVTETQLFDEIKMETLPKENNQKSGKKKKTGWNENQGSTKSRSERLTKQFFREQRRQALLRVMNLIAKFVMPVIFSAFSAGYCIYGLMIYNNVI